jgi:hypothetical protein
MFLESTAPAVGAPDGVKDLIDNQRITICDVTWTKGNKWPMTQYNEDTLVVPLSAIALRASTPDGKGTTVSLKPGDVKFWPKGTHQALEPANDGRAIVAHFKDFAVKPYQNTSGFGAAFPRPRIKKLLENDRIGGVGLHVGEGTAHTDALSRQGSNDRVSRGRRHPIGHSRGQGHAERVQVRGGAVQPGQPSAL